MWDASAAENPANIPPYQRLVQALKYAALAPSEINWHPWKFRLMDTHLELIANHDAALEVEDPDGRELMIGCGAALHHLKLALKYSGGLGRVELFPDLDEPALAARVHLGSGREPDGQEKLLFAAMTRGRARSALAVETPVSETMLALLSQAVAGERGWLEFAHSESSRQRIMEITGDGESRGMISGHSPALAGNAAPRMPVSRWSQPFYAFGAPKVQSSPVVVEPPCRLPLSAGTLAVVKTKTDDKHGWLAAGQALARAVLQVQAWGLSWSFFNQMRRRTTREALRLGLGHKGFAQIILRLGPLAAAESFRPGATASATAGFR